MGKDSVGEELSKCKDKAVGMHKAHSRQYVVGILTEIEDSHKGLD